MANRPRSLDTAGHEAGFTLFELIAVLVIAALIAGTIMFANRSDSGQSGLKAAAAQVASGLRHSRGHAIRTGRETVTRIDTAASRIEWGTTRQGYKLTGGIGLTVVTAESERRGKVAGIRFFPNGSSTGGRLGLSSSGLRFDVAVNWLTGHVSVEQVR